MQIEEIKTLNAPPPRGAYSQAVKVGNMIYTAGQLPISPETNEPIKGDIEQQTHLVLDNLKSVIEAAGSDLDHVIKTTVFIADMDNWDKVNQIYGEYFTGQVLPSRSIVATQALHYGMLIEIEAVALPYTKRKEQ